MLRALCPAVMTTTDSHIWGSVHCCENRSHLLRITLQEGRIVGAQISGSLRPINTALLLAFLSSFTLHTRDHTSFTTFMITTEKTDIALASAAWEGGRDGGREGWRILQVDNWNGLFPLYCPIHERLMD